MELYPVRKHVEGRRPTCTPRLDRWQVLKVHHRTRPPGFARGLFQSRMPDSAACIPMRARLFPRLPQRRLGACERLAKMTASSLIPTLEHPRISAGRVGEDLPTIVVSVPEEEAVATVLNRRLADLVQAPFFSVPEDESVALIHFGFGVDIESIVIQEWQLAGTLVADRDTDIDMLATEAAPDGAWTRLHHLEAEKLLVEPAGECEITTFERSMGDELQLERGLGLGFGARCVVFVGHASASCAWIGGAFLY